MTRILAYNILVGGKERIDQIERMIRSVDPDVVGLVEAMNVDIVKELARRLGMEYRTDARIDGCPEPEIALLSRLPIIASKVHVRSVFRAGAILEVCVQPKQGENLTVFVAHLTADFFHRRAGDGRRSKEVREILSIMQANRGPHVLMGDFNALAPGDTLKASNLLRYLVELDRYRNAGVKVRRGQPTLNYVIPRRLRFLKPVLHLIARNQILSMLFDEFSSLYAPRGSIALLRAAGYVDCFRYVNPRAWGFTCPAAAPAGRIDYFFANPLLAKNLNACKAISGDEELDASEASDHLPIMVEFGTEVATAFRQPLDAAPVEARRTAGKVL